MFHPSQGKRESSKKCCVCGAIILYKNETAKKNKQGRAYNMTASLIRLGCNVTQRPKLTEQNDTQSAGRRLYTAIEFKYRQI